MNRYVWTLAVPLIAAVIILGVMIGRAMVAQ